MIYYVENEKCDRHRHDFKKSVFALLNIPSCENGSNKKNEKIQNAYPCAERKNPLQSFCILFFHKRQKNDKNGNRVHDNAAEAEKPVSYRGEKRNFTDSFVRHKRGCHKAEHRRHKHCRCIKTLILYLEVVFHIDKISQRSDSVDKAENRKQNNMLFADKTDGFVNRIFKKNK